MRLLDNGNMACLNDNAWYDIASKKYWVEHYQFSDGVVTKLLVITLKLRTITSLRHQHITGMAFYESIQCPLAFAVRGVTWFTDYFAFELVAGLHASGRYCFQ